MKAKTGDYLSASSPNTLFEYLTPFLEKSFVFVEHPFSIAGHGTSSTGGSARFDDNHPRAQPRMKFAAESATDPLEDPLPGPYPTMAVAMFSVLEKVRKDWSDEVAKRPDYLSWYRHILSSDNHRPRAHETVVERLGAYAETIGTGDAFRAAMQEGGPLPPRLSYALRRIAKNFRLDGRMTISGRRGRVNTIETAAAVADRVLGEHAASAAGQPQRRARLWRGARLRGLAYRI